MFPPPPEVEGLFERLLMSEEQQTISQILCAARAQRGLDIDTVYRHTGISLPVLTGMEADRFDIIELVFARMALQSYAEYLGLESEPLLARFDQEMGPVTPPTPVEVATSQKTTPGPRLPLPLDSVVLRTIGLGLGALVILLLAISIFDGSDQTPATQAPPPEPAPAQSATSAPKSDLIPESAKPTTALATTAEPVTDEPPPATQEQNASVATPSATPPVAAEQDPAPGTGTSEPVVDQPPTATTDQGEVDQPPTSTTDQDDEPVAQTTTDTSLATTPPVPASHSAVENSAPAQIASTTPPVTTEPTTSPQPVAPSATAAVVLAVEALDSTWVQIRWDGRGKFEGTIPRGERRRWEASDHFLVLSGRAHGLRYWLDDQLLGDGQLGEATEVLRFRATTDGIEFLGPNFQPLPDAAAAAQP